jgi:hypothetical protein
MIREDDLKKERDTGCDTRALTVLARLQPGEKPRRFSVNINGTAPGNMPMHMARCQLTNSLKMSLLNVSVANSHSPVFSAAHGPGFGEPDSKIRQRIETRSMELSLITREHLKAR